MGQKANSNLLRLGVNNNEWKSKYFSKTLEESSVFVFKNLEIKNYLTQILEKNGLALHDYKFYLNTRTTYVYISYFIKLKSIFIINKNNLNQHLRLKKEYNYYKKLKKKNHCKSYFINTFQQRNFLLKNYKSFLYKKKYDNKIHLQNSNFAEEILETLNQFVGKNVNVYITFQNLNSNLNVNLRQGNWRSKLLLLKRYKKNKFFKETINILLLTIKSKNSAELLAEFLAKQFSSLKKQSYFLLFLKKSFSLFILSPESKITGIKLLINGRLNGRPRARQQSLTFGSVPSQTLNKNINYHQSTSFSSNGTFGIKVWIAEK